MRLIVGFPAGSTPDLVARTIADLDGSPAITDGKKVHDTVVGFFKTAADSVAVKMPERMPPRIRTTTEIPDQPATPATATA